MLLEFQCSNHKSIKEEVHFSMIAGSDHTSEDFLKEHGNFRVLRSAVIYGANGSGKSNFIHALWFVRSLVSNSINHQPGEKIFQAPFFSLVKTWWYITLKKITGQSILLNCCKIMVQLKTYFLIFYSH